jgi:hypothetical protein
MKHVHVWKKMRVAYIDLTGKLEKKRTIQLLNK